MNSGHKLVKQFKGHSGSQIYLREWPDGGLYVEKLGNTERNLERLTVLAKAGLPVPKIIMHSEEQLIMEYLPGLDIKTYLIHNYSSSLIQFITELIDVFSRTVVGYKDYTETYHQKLDWLPKDFIFTKQELIDRLPKLLPQSMYHGDLTLENILYTEPGFHLIDAVTIEYDSYVFDIAKLRQDTVCKWFLRNSDARLDVKLNIIDNVLKTDYVEACNDSLLILMLLRVLKRCEKDDANYIFLMREIERLWK